MAQGEFTKEETIDKSGNSLLALLEGAETRKFTRQGANHQISEYIFADESQKKLAWVREDFYRMVVDGKENLVFIVPIVGISLAEARVRIAGHYDRYWLFGLKEVENDL